MKSMTIRPPKSRRTNLAHRLPRRFLIGAKGGLFEIAGPHRPIGIDIDRGQRLRAFDGQLAAGRQPAMTRMETGDLLTQAKMLEQR